MITDTIWGVPYCSYGIIYPKTLFQLLRPLQLGRYRVSRLGCSRVRGSGFYGPGLDQGVPAVHFATITRRSCRRLLSGHIFGSWSQAYSQQPVTSSEEQLTTSRSRVIVVSTNVIQCNAYIYIHRSEAVFLCPYRPYLIYPPKRPCSDAPHVQYD